MFDSQLDPDCLGAEAGHGPISFLLRTYRQYRDKLGSGCEDDLHGYPQLKEQNGLRLETGLTNCEE